MKQYFNELLKGENSMSREASNYPSDGSLMFEWKRIKDAKAICFVALKSINENDYIKSYKRTKSS